MKFLVIFSIIFTCTGAHPIQNERIKDAWAKTIPFFYEELVYNRLFDLPEDVLLSNQRDLKKLAEEAVSELGKQVKRLKLKIKKVAEKDAVLLEKLTPSQEFAGKAAMSNKVPDTENLTLNKPRLRKLHKRNTKNQVRVTYTKCLFNPITCF